MNRDEMENSQGPAGISSTDRGPMDLAEAWQRGEIAAREVWAKYAEASVTTLAAMVKIDLRFRFARGERVEVADYLKRMPRLCKNDERVVSLVYEEYCLREEVGEAPDADEFCARYEPWRDSLESQLKYHRLLSQVAGTPPTPPRFPEPGEWFLQFRLRSILGQGGAGRVFLADDNDLGDRLRALKISPDRGEEPSIMGRLEHRYIMPVYSVARDDESGLRGLCMPYRPGRPLDDVLKRMEKVPLSDRTARTFWQAAAPDGSPDGPSGPGWQGYPIRGSYADAIAWLGAALADALHHAHAHDILHRDVKPANVLMTAECGPQLLDFNLAHDPHTADRADEAIRGGTLPYMAPEQIRAFLNSKLWSEVGHHADIYSLGLLLQELLTGRRPEAPAGGDISLPRAIQEMLDWRSQPGPGPHATNATVPHALDAIVCKCLAPQATQRYPDAAVLADDLRRFLRRQSLRCVSNPSVPEATKFWLVRNSINLIGAAAVLLALVVLAGAVSNSHRMNLLDQAARSFRGGDHQQAVELYLQVCALDPDNATARNGLAATYRDWARRSIESNIDLDQSVKLSQAQTFAELLRESQQWGYTLTPEDAEQVSLAALNLALYSKKAADAEQAKGLAAQANRVAPDFWRTRHAQAALAFKAGDYEQYHQLIRETLQLATESEFEEKPRALASLAIQDAWGCLLTNRLRLVPDATQRAYDYIHGVDAVNNMLETWRRRSLAQFFFLEARLNGAQLESGLQWLDQNNAWVLLDQAIANCEVALSNDPTATNIRRYHDRLLEVDTF